jgi:hypothetical protein
MSYCRWSSDDFQCDVYVYESAHGWETHVAGQRPVLDVAALPPAPSRTPDGQFDVAAWMVRHHAVMAQLDGCERRPIGLPHDGESFTDATPGECADRLEALRALGYNVPQGAIDALREEAEDVVA